MDGLSVLRTFSSIDIAAKLSFTTFALAGALDGTFTDIDRTRRVKKKWMMNRVKMPRGIWSRKEVVALKVLLPARG
jgi:hypothetical protein